MCETRGFFCNQPRTPESSWLVVTSTGDPHTACARAAVTLLDEASTTDVADIAVPKYFATATDVAAAVEPLIRFAFGSLRTVVEVTDAFVVTTVVLDGRSDFR